MRASRPLSLVVAITLLTIGVLATAPRAQAKDVTFVIEAKEIAFSPDVLRVEPGDNVTIIVFNNESNGLPHTFDLDAFGVHLGSVLPGENRSATFTADRNGTFYFYCDIGGHATNHGTPSGTGMVGTLQVGEPSSPSDPTPVIVGGLLILFVSLAAIVYAARRGSKKPKSP